MGRDPLRRSIASRIIWLATVAVVGVGLLWLRPVSLAGPTGWVPIYRGVWYSSERIQAGEDGEGLAHLVKVDLSTPGVELFITSVDSGFAHPEAQYRLAFAQSVVVDKRLAVVINGTMYRALASFPLPGTLADSHEMVVSEGVVNHLPRNSYCYLVWFDEDLTPRMETTKPLSLEAVGHARWAISGVSLALRDGHILPTKGGPIDRRTIIGIDRSRKLLWLAVFDRATYHAAAQTLAAAGATDAILVDGGDSTAMAIGPACGVVSGGTVLGGRRPVATFFGLLAEPIETPNDAIQR